MKVFSNVESRANRDKKIKICKSCEHYNSTLKQCKICLCIIPLKAWTPGNTCPIKKWNVNPESRPG